MSSGIVTELSKLASATGAVEDKLSLCANSVSNVSIGDFNINEVVSLSAQPGYVTGDPTGFGFNTIFGVEMIFGGVSARFNRIADLAVNPNANPTNFTWSNSATVMDTMTNRGFKRTYRNKFFNTSSTCDTTLPVIITSRFRDQNFNDHASNYNTTLVTFVTLYSPPKPSLSPTGGTRPPRPCTGGGGCNGATYTIAVAHGNFGNIQGSSSDIYLDGSFHGTTAAGSYTFYNLVGNTGYSAYSINEYNCQSSTIFFTTPAYV